MTTELAGLALREAVATKVFGLDATKLWSHDGAKNVPPEDRKPTLCYRDALWPPPTTCVVPAYELEISAAIAVVEKIQQAKRWVRIDVKTGLRANGSGEIRIASATVIPNNASLDPYGIYPTGTGEGPHAVEEAICRAALAALESEAPRG